MTCQPGGSSVNSFGGRSAAAAADVCCCAFELEVVSFVLLIALP